MVATGDNVGGPSLQSSTSDLAPYWSPRVQQWEALIAREAERRDLDPDPFWKRLALSEGEQVLYTLWGDGVIEETELQRFDKLISSYARRNALEAMKVREIQPINAIEVLQEYGMIRKLEIEAMRAETEAGLGGPGGYEFVAALMHSVQFAIAPVTPGSDAAFVEMTSALEQGPALLARLQGAAAEKPVDVPDHKDS